MTELEKLLLKALGLEDQAGSILEINITCKPRQPMLVTVGFLGPKDELNEFFETIYKEYQIFPKPELLEGE